MDKGQEEYILMNNGVVAEHHVMLELREGGKTPTQAEIDAAVIRVQAEFDASQYARNRKAEYPDLAEQFDLLFHDMTSGKGDKTGEWYKAVNKVKTDNPKG
tara:strand:- start:264 stop:566 length:303 start_codon:yes stop_codon:yes gene_type:complete